MSLKCWVGLHAWDGCVCTACGATRAEHPPAGPGPQNHPDPDGPESYGAPEPAEGKGLSDDLVEISTLAQLQAVRDNLTGRFRIVTPLDAVETRNWNNGRGFLPIGSAKAPFTGLLEGGEHAIRNLFIALEGEEPAGLIGNLGPKGCVRHVHLANASIRGNKAVGGVAGMSSGTLSHCSVTGAVTGQSQVGGLIGWSLAGRLAECHSCAAVTGESAVGGLVGAADATTLMLCQASGPVQGRDGVGGVAGSTLNAPLSKCRSFCDVTGDKTVGGLVGHHAQAVRQPLPGLFACLASGRVTGRESEAGGLVGLNEGAAVSRCQFLGRIAGARYTGGLAGSLVSGTLSECLAAGEVGGTLGVGGAAGTNVGGLIRDCLITGRVEGKDQVGGLVGFNHKAGRILNCLSGAVASGARLTGGLVGANNQGLIDSAYWDSEISGQENSAGGEGRPTIWLKKQATFPGWDFERIWSLEEGLDYPRLRQTPRDS